MKTLYVPLKQFFKGRHDQFLNILAKNHRLIVHRAINQMEGMPTVNSKNLLFVEDLSSVSKELANQPAFEKEWKRYIHYLGDKTTDLAGQQFSQDLTTKNLATIRENMAALMVESLQLNEVSQKVNIDMVVLSSDYARHSRPTAVAAKKLGIPTVNIDHGLFGTLPNASMYKKAPPLRYISDYVILDNKLETSIVASYADPRITKAFLPLGTPIETAMPVCNTTRQTARTKLGLSPDTPTVTAILRWHEPNATASLLKSHMDEVLFIRHLLGAVSAVNQTMACQLIIKAHPAIIDFGQETACLRFYQQLAATFGLADQVLVTADSLELTVAASNFVISYNTSSVLWDAVMQGRRTAVYVAPSLQPLMADGNLNAHSELGIVNLLQYVRNEQELMSAVKWGLTSDADTSTENRTEKELSAFIEKWSLHPKTVNQKSTNISDWIQNFSESAALSM